VSRPPTEGDDPPPSPARKIIRRQKAGLPETPPSEAWVKIETYPNLDEFVRGVDIFRTKEPWPLRYRVVISVRDAGNYLIPAVVGIANERGIRFGTAPMEFGVLDSATRKVGEWRTDLPDFRNRDVILSNPDYVRMTKAWEPAS